MFIGRKRELELLLRTEPLSVLYGPPGIGKTRLVKQLGRISAHRRILFLADAGSASLDVMLAALELPVKATETELARSLSNVWMLVDDWDPSGWLTPSRIQTWAEAAPSLKMTLVAERYVPLLGAVQHSLGPLDSGSFRKIGEDNDAWGLFWARLDQAGPGVIFSSATTSGLRRAVKRLLGHPAAIVSVADQVALRGANPCLDDERLWRADSSRLEEFGELDPIGQRLLSASCVFSGLFEVAALAFVARITEDEAFPLMERLLRSSLLARVTNDEGAVFFQAHFGVREAAESLLSTEHREALFDRHAEWINRRIESELVTLRYEAVEISKHSDDLLAIAGRIEERNRPSIEAGLMAVSALSRMAEEDGGWAESAASLDAVLALARDRGVSGEGRALACVARARIASRRADSANTQQLCDEAIEHASTTGAKSGALQTLALYVLGFEYLLRQESAQAHAAFNRIDESVELPMPLAGYLLLRKSKLATLDGNAPLARDLNEQSARFFRANNSPYGELLARDALAKLALDAGQKTEAVVHLARMEELGAAFSSRSLAAWLSLRRGNLEVLRERPADALIAYRQAADSYAELGHDHGRLVSRLSLAALLVTSSPAVATEELNLAKDIALALGRLHLLESVRLVELHLALALADHNERRDQLQGQLNGVLVRLGNPLPPFVNFLHDFILPQISVHADAPADLAVCARGEWFERPGEPRVNLHHRRPLKLILQALATQQTSPPTDGLGVDDLRQLAWPDEHIAPTSAAQRVYVAISTLRKMGLRELLVREEAGYRFSVEANIKVSGEAVSKNN